MPAPSVPYVLFDDPADMCARANQLVRLVRSGPAGTSSLGSGLWDGVLGPAMLAKAAGTLASMILLLPAHGVVDAMTLLRALYEGTVQLSWVAIDPDAHLPSWYATSSYWEWREHCYWEKAGRGLRSPEEAEELKKDGGTREDRLPGVPTMAAEADEHWGTLVPGWSPTSNADDPGLFSSMRGLYGYIYQRGSAATHARARGLDPFLSEVDGKTTIHAETPASDYHVYALGLYTLAFAIAAAEQSLGWPSWREATRILGREAEVFGRPSAP